MPLFLVTIFLSAFLLFLVQPLIGKFILPWFGGTPAVWSTCVLFFQVMLLVGYGYAHLVALRLKPRVQALLHIGLLGGSLLLLPIAPSDNWKPQTSDSPTKDILLLLFVHVGMPYALVASTAPLLQSWFARLFSGKSPYRLYSLSNLGSLLALGAYPFFVETNFRLGQQTWLWTGLYALFAVLCSLCGAAILRHEQQSGSPAPSLAENPSLQSSAVFEAKSISSKKNDLAPSIWKMGLWLALPALGTLMLLATTNQMCLDVASVPFLWILPLAVYLLSFIISFDHARWYWRPLYGAGLFLAVLLVLLPTVEFPTWISAPLKDSAGNDLPLSFTGNIYSGFLDLLGEVKDQLDTLMGRTLMYLLTLFMSCMIFHGELVRKKPSHSHLTLFYLMISAGGALGGLFVTLAAPHIFSDFHEFYWGLGACCLLAAGIFTGERFFNGGLNPQGLEAGWGSLLTLLAFTLYFSFKAVIQENTSDAKDTLLARRNFYGVVRVVEKSADSPTYHYSYLINGSTIHGVQYHDPSKKELPTSYYVPGSGIGLAIEKHPRRHSPDPFRIGVIGLGAGGLSAYARNQDSIVFYEIDPKIQEIAHSHFSYLEDATKRGANVEVVMGDARILLERELLEENNRMFDVLVVDAFSSDAIPMHLLTAECFKIYWGHLKPDGILAVHTSNRHLDLKKVVRKHAYLANQEAIWIDYHAENNEGYSSDWVLVTSNTDFINNPEIFSLRTFWENDSPEPILWTDDFSSLFQVLDDDSVKTLFGLVKEKPKTPSSNEEIMPE